MEEITVAKNFVKNFNAKRRGISNYFESLEDYEDIEPIVIGRNVSKKLWEKFVRHLAERDNLDRWLSLRFIKLEKKRGKKISSLQRRMEIPRVMERNGSKNINSVNNNTIVHVVQMI